jgi:hypothetical protein
MSRFELNCIIQQTGCCFKLEVNYLILIVLHSSTFFFLSFYFFIIIIIKFLEILVSGSLHKHGIILLNLECHMYFQI